MLPASSFFFFLFIYLSVLSTTLLVELTCVKRSWRGRTNDLWDSVLSKGHRKTFAFVQSYTTYRRPRERTFVVAKFRFVIFRSISPRLSYLTLSLSLFSSAVSSVLSVVSPRSSLQRLHTFLFRVFLDGAFTAAPWILPEAGTRSSRPGIYIATGSCVRGRSDSLFLSATPRR